MTFSFLPGEGDGGFFEDALAGGDFGRSLQRRRPQFQQAEQRRQRAVGHQVGADRVHGRHVGQNRGDLSQNLQQQKKQL